MVKVVSIVFKEGGKQYYFAPGKDKYEKGMGVIVETSKGLEYAKVYSPEDEVDEKRVVAPLKPIVRIATQKDEEQVRRNAARVPDAMRIAEEKITARGLEMRLSGCEFAFDGSKVVFYFTADSRVDFRELIKDLSAAFHMRIELRQIGIRDEIKMMGGFGPCGRECCCVSCMNEPKKVSVKMAKNQGLSLNPGKISGLCNRLMCCLSYENDFYSEVCKRVPKLGSEAETPDGKGTVVNVNMLKMEVKVKIEEKDAVSYHDYPVDKIRFKRGNEVFGDLQENGDGNARADDGGEEEHASEAVESFHTEKPTGEPRPDKHGKNFKGGNRNGQNNRPNDRQNGQNNRPNDKQNGQNNRPHGDGGNAGRPFKGKNADRRRSDKDTNRQKNNV